MSTNEYKLIKRIIKLSESATWEDAVKEWELTDTYILEEDYYDECLCGHWPIRECCIIRNTYNYTEKIVGNCCVKKFTSLPSGKIFDAHKRVQSGKGNSYNRETIKLAYDNGWIKEADYNFYTDIWRKRKLSEKQEKWKKDIHRRINNHLSVAK